MKSLFKVRLNSPPALKLKREEEKPVGGGTVFDFQEARKRVLAKHAQAFFNKNYGEFRRFAAGEGLAHGSVEAKAAFLRQAVSKFGAKTPQGGAKALETKAPLPVASREQQLLGALKNNPAVLKQVAAQVQHKAAQDIFLRQYLLQQKKTA